MKPLFDDDERQIMTEACKWVKETHQIPEYVIDMTILDRLKVDYVMHGDDIVLDEKGECMYTPFMKANKYR